MDDSTADVDVPSNEWSKEPALAFTATREPLTYTYSNDFRLDMALRDARAGVTRSERESILESLYALRTSVLKKRRLEGLQQSEESYLRDIEAEIDSWEASEVEPLRERADWAELERIAKGVLTAYVSTNGRR